MIYYLYTACIIPVCNQTIHDSSLLGALCSALHEEIHLVVPAGGSSGLVPDLSPSLSSVLMTLAMTFDRKGLTCRKA